ncbi:MAG: LysR family transcriptional regulator [Oscillospiraceae bacterium]|nr:LysR family transcriptional regulator [Oscillospiraceae bacterium]
MTFQQLRYLIEVCKAGSISKAAENLFVSRPSVSLSISSLEAELGYPIFIRSQNGLIPSPEGEMVIKYASSICHTHEMIRNINTKPQVKIKLSVVKYPPVNRAVIRLLSEYKDQDDIRFHITTNTWIPAKDLSQGNIDLALSFNLNIKKTPTSSKINHWNLLTRELIKIPMAICIGPGHRLYHKKELSPADFKDDPVLDTGKQAWTSTGMLKGIIGATPRNVIMLYNNTTLKLDILNAGLAYSIRRIPDKNAPDDGLRYIPLDGVYHKLLCVADPNRPQHAAVKRFIEILEEELSK